MQGWAVPPQGPQQGAVSGAGPAPEQSVLTPGDFRKILIKRKWIIVACLVAGLAYAIFYIVTTVPQYEAISRIHIDLSRSTNIGIEDLIEQKLGGGEDSSEKLQTEIRIMQSESVVMEVINKLDLYHKPPIFGVVQRASLQWRAHARPALSAHSHVSACDQGAGSAQHRSSGSAFPESGPCGGDECRKPDRRLLPGPRSAIEIRRHHEGIRLAYQAIDHGQEAGRGFAEVSDRLSTRRTICSPSMLKAGVCSPTACARSTSSLPRLRRIESSKRRATRWRKRAILIC